MHPSKRKGDAAEREVQGILRDLLGVPARRQLGAGRKDDIGDISGLENTVIQVTDRADLAAAIRIKLPETVAQQHRAGALFGALFARRRGGQYVVCMTVEQFCTLWREAQSVEPPPPKRTKQPADPIKQKRERELREFLSIKFPKPSETDYKPW